MVICLIKYNFRKKGPYEKDKFALSILNFHNELEDMKEDIKNSAKYGKELVDTIKDNNYNNIYIEAYRKGVL